MQNKIEYQHHRFMAVKFVVTAPIIYALVFPVVLLDLCTEIYHRLCFPLYGLSYLRRSDYVIVTDRTKLQYLTWYEKLNCGYCGYVNGVLRYMVAIASTTERYWCGIQHAKHAKPVPAAEQDYLPYGDKKALEEFVDHGKDIHDNPQRHV